MISACIAAMAVQFGALILSAMRIAQQEDDLAKQEIRLGKLWTIREAARVFVADSSRENFEKLKQTI